MIPQGPTVDTVNAEDRAAVKREECEPEMYDLTGEGVVGGRKRKRVETIDLTDD